MTAQQPPAEPDARVQRLLGGATLAHLRQRLRRAIERRIDGANGQSLLLTQLSATEHEALALLTGRPAGTARSARIDIARLDAALRAPAAMDRNEPPRTPRKVQPDHSQARPSNGAPVRLVVWQSCTHSRALPSISTKSKAFG